MSTGYQGFKQSAAYEHDQRWTDIDAYTSKHLHHDPALNAALDRALQNSDANNLPPISVSAHQGKMLSLLARVSHAKHILEVGLLGGYSTIWLASSAPDVKVTTVEYSAAYAEVARRNLEHAGLADRVEIVVGAGADVLPKLAEEVKAGNRPRFDLVFVDADKENSWTYADVAAGMAKKDGLLVVDNVVRRGATVGGESAADEGNRRLVENVGKDERFDATVVQLVGDKNYDGWLVAAFR